MGALAVLAVPDTHDGNRPRFEGRWDQAGFRLTEHHRGSAAAYYLWSWTNPQPDLLVERVELVPHGVPFLVAAVTLGHADEHPFVRVPARPVRLVVTNVKTAAPPDALEVDVDRGVATYPQPVPDSDRVGPAYANIAAIPSATLTVSHAGDELGRVAWRDVET